MEHKFILASSSPRRKYLLSMLFSNFGLNFDIIPANISEYIPKNATNYKDLVQGYAEQKALKVARNYEGIVIGADTIVVLGNRILGKPKGDKESKIMLRKLSGKWHEVYTGVTIICSPENKIFKDYEVTRVKFRKISKEEIDFYTTTGSPLDKAGGYGIQDDFGSTFVEKIEGDYFTVVGLPVLKTYLGLRKLVPDLKLIV
jgi:septum formation protein